MITVIFLACCRPEIAADTSDAATVNRVGS